MSIESNNPFTPNRRTFLSHAAGGVGLLALQSLLAEEVISSEHKFSESNGGPLAPRKPTHAPRAKSVILLFQNGGPSQVDLFDAKPELKRRHGKPYPGKVEAHFDKQVKNILGSPFKFHKHGQCGMELSELLPQLGSIADDITLVRSMYTSSVDHERALRTFHSGSPIVPKASLGSWVVYGLGTERAELPAYVVLTDPSGLPIDGTSNWSSGYLPAVYQGTQFRTNGLPVANLSTPSDVSPGARTNQLEFISRLNRSHLRKWPDHSELQARISNFELAARMQVAVPDAVDLSKESKATLKLYGLDNPKTKDYGRRCLLARRLVEQGVRFVSVYMKSQPWDTHSKNAESLKGLCAGADLPSAALIKDLKQRGMLNDTIVIWSGEFGRLPVSQGADGRDHNRHAFSAWLAGGGFKRGYTHGSTDEFGYKAADNPVHVHDLHATLLHALGLDHEHLSYPHEGRDSTLTDFEVTGAEVVHDLFEKASEKI